MKTPQQKYPKKRSAGFSLIEFLVASVLSMIVLIAIGSGYFAARKINDVALGRLGVQQDMRNAANLIVRDARMAGSFGCFNMANKEPATVGSDGSASSNTPRNLMSAGQTTGLVPVKTPAGSTFNVTGFTASGDALVFQYGIGSASITGNNNGTMTMQMPADDPLQNISSKMPLVFSSCNVIDRPTSFTATRSGTGVTINNINPALNTDHVAAEMSILRYAVNAYVIGTTTAGEQGLYRIQLGDDNNWQSPQLLLPGITAMLAADQFHTFAEWKRMGYSVKKGAKSAITCQLWKYTDKPGKAARKAAKLARMAAAKGEAAAPAAEESPKGKAKK